VSQIYKLNNAIALNATGKKENVLAVPVKAGMVAFRHQKDYLDCVNMEINGFNKRGISLYSGVGKCMVALCCKISMDNGSEGFISFEAKNRLIPYYQRLGAKRIGSSSRMFLDDIAAQKLIDLYF
jgi:hypothetical protein